MANGVLPPMQLLNRTTNVRRVRRRESLDRDDEPISQPSLCVCVSARNKKNS